MRRHFRSRFSAALKSTGGSTAAGPPYEGPGSSSELAMDTATKMDGEPREEEHRGFRRDKVSVYVFVLTMSLSSYMSFLKSSIAAAVDATSASSFDSFSALSARTFSGTFSSYPGISICF